MNKLVYPVLLSSSLILTACGGGSGTTATSSSGNTTGSSPAAAKTYAVKGTVPGTLIEAFCDNGAYFSTRSTQNGTSQHPFQLDLPVGMGCHLVMTTNEDDPANRIVTPVGFVDANGQVSTRITANTESTIDLGHVDLFLDRNDTGGFDADGDGVIDQPMDLGSHPELSVFDAGKTTLDPDGDGIIEPYDDEDGDGIINREDNDYSHKDRDRDRDGLLDSIDVNADNDPNATNTYPAHLDHDGDGYLDEDRDHDGFFDDDADRDGFHDDDKNRDGFHDDDANHDGFHDDDANHDGFHDDDLNHDGRHDNLEHGGEGQDDRF